MKVCYRCKKSKDLSEFGKNKIKKDGLSINCKKCANELKRKSYERNKEKRIAKQKEYQEKNKEKYIQYRKEYHAKNRDKINARKKAWYEENKEVKLAKNKEWLEANKEKYKKWYEETKEERNATQKKWREQNRDKIYFNNLKRRSLKNNVKISEFERKEILERDDYTCQNCGIKVHDRRTGEWNDEYKAHLDHIIPVSKGGDSTKENLQVLCRTCNLSKMDKSDLEIAEHGQLKINI